MRFQVHIACDNDAFTDESGPNPEVVRLLRAVANRLEGGDTIGLIRLRDHNGNRVGFAEFAEFGEG
jgi:hypothetical protein